MVKSTLKFSSGTPNSRMFFTTSFNSLIPLLNNSFSIFKSSSLCNFSFEVPSISINAIIFSMACFSIFCFCNSSITFSFPILSILSIVLKISTEDSFCPKLWNNPFSILRLLMQMVKSSKPSSLKIVYMMLGSSASFIKSSSPSPITSISHW